MTFINRRIIKRPTLFASSRRNFGNLLTHYETGQDGTTPEPGPDPDPTTPISFTVSWATNGGIIQANLVGIQDGDGTEVITLTRDDGSILATLASGSLGNHTLQHDEGTNYNTYTYTIRLDGVIESTFSRDYQPNVPTFTTNFFSNTAKRISCGIENIVNPHDSYSVRLARPDDTILDTQVLNDATPFFLQFTELDYGTYDYKLLLSKWTTTSTSNPNIPPESYWVDTVIATHTQLFPRPEPTFTTSWTKSGLTVNADLSSIVGAHPEFYAYLCRDDGTTLATHQFQTGQTTASLSHTETDYGTFTYQLKLGTTVVSSHTETYVRPTPTFTASFSTNELTLTASITSITNAHNSFAITLERDDGTELSTHTLVDGETSFTFTQNETSYATFNYIVKLNGTQTDTYTATYTPPPTPTFDIALTNDDLAITATLTNIVNPDPYYTLMIHDANDTHLDGHTFATGDTTAVLTWTETSYGEKTYTKLLNGASTGTETITLTDPNASTPTQPIPNLTIINGSHAGNIFKDVNILDSNGYRRMDLYFPFGGITQKVSSSGDNGIGYNPSTKNWKDFGQDGAGNPRDFSATTNFTGASDNVTNTEFVHIRTGNNTYFGYITNHDYEAPSTLKWNFSDKHDGTAEGFNVHDDQSPPCYVEKASDGTWSLTLTGDLANRQDQSAGNNWDYIETIGGTVYLNFKNWDTGGYWSGPYTRAEWSSSIGSETIRIYEHSSYSEQYNNGIFLIQESSSSTPPTPEATIYPTSGAWNNQHYFVCRGDIVQNGTTYFHYSLDFQSGNTIGGYSILYDYTNKIWKDGDSAAPFYLHSSVPLVGTSFTITNPAHLHGFDTNSTEYFGFPNPYYEA